MTPRRRLDFSDWKTTYNGPKNLPVGNTKPCQGDRRDRRLRRRAHVGDRARRQAPVQRAGHGDAPSPARGDHQLSDAGLQPGFVRQRQSRMTLPKVRSDSSSSYAPLRPAPADRRFDDRASRPSASNGHGHLVQDASVAAAFLLTDIARAGTVPKRVKRLASIDGSRSVKKGSRHRADAHDAAFGRGRVDVGDHVVAADEVERHVRAAVGRLDDRPREGVVSSAPSACAAVRCPRRARARGSVRACRRCARCRRRGRRAHARAAARRYRLPNRSRARAPIRPRRRALA